MDIALGVSMTPTAVRMVLVEGEKADGVTVDHDVFDIASDQSSATAPEQVVAAILGTRESATEGGHRLVATGVTWRNHDDATRLRAALAAHHIDDVMLVPELHAAGELARAAGAAVGYQRTGLLFLDGDTATVSAVETADGSIVRVERQDLHSEDAVAQLTAMVGALDQLEAPPQGIFVVGSGVSVAALKLQLESATTLPVSAPDEAGFALARGAALAGTRAPLFEASTVERDYAHDGDEATTAGAAHGAGHGADAALAYSEVDDESGFVDTVVPDTVVPDAAEVAQQGRKPFLLVGSAMTGVFVLGVAALVISLAVSIRPTVDERPSPVEAVIVSTEAQDPTPAVPPAPAAPLETSRAPIPVVQEAPQPQAPPRTVFVQQPAAAVPAAPAPVALAPPPVALAPPPAPAAPPVVAPPVVAPAPVPIVVPQLPVVHWPWEPNDGLPSSPPQQDWYPEQPEQQAPSSWYPQQPEQQAPPSWDPPQQQTTPSWDPPQQQMPRQAWPQWPQKSGSDSRRGSDGSGGRGSNGGNSLWPWPSWGH